MSTIQIIVGTVTGTAEGVAEYLEKQLAGEHQVSINCNASSEDLVRDNTEILIFCTSNTGNGDLPDNIEPLYFELDEGSVDLQDKRYALINIGSSSFPTFGEGGAKLERAINGCAATALGASLLVDTDTDRYPQKLAWEWLSALL